MWGTLAVPLVKCFAIKTVVALRFIKSTLTLKLGCFSLHKSVSPVCSFGNELLQQAWVKQQRGRKGEFQANRGWTKENHNSKKIKAFGEKMWCHKKIDWSRLKIVDVWFTEMVSDETLEDKEKKKDFWFPTLCENFM